MKRRELEQRLRRAGCYLKREGGSHSLWTNPRSGVVEAIPRHAEVKEPLAWRILRSLGAERVSQGTLVRRALRAYGITPEAEKAKTGYDVVAHLVGACKGGPSDLSTNPPW